MHSHRCEQIYKETFLLLRPNNLFFLTSYFRDTDHLMYICCHLSVFPNDPVRICPVKLKIVMLYHMNNLFEKLLRGYLTPHL